MKIIKPHVPPHVSADTPTTTVGAVPAGELIGLLSPEGHYRLPYLVTDRGRHRGGHPVHRRQRPERIGIVNPDIGYLIWVHKDTPGILLEDAACVIDVKSKAPPPKGCESLNTTLRSRPEPVLDVDAQKRILESLIRTAEDATTKRDRARTKASVERAIKHLRESLADLATKTLTQSIVPDSVKEFEAEKRAEVRRKREAYEERQKGYLVYELNRAKAERAQTKPERIYWDESGDITPDSLAILDKWVKNYRDRRNRVRAEAGVPASDTDHFAHELNKAFIRGRLYLQAERRKQQAEAYIAQFFRDLHFKNSEDENPDTGG